MREVRQQQLLNLLYNKQPVWDKNHHDMSRIPEFEWYSTITRDKVPICSSDVRPLLREGYAVITEEGSLLMTEEGRRYVELPHWTAERLRRESKLKPY